jgi:hypothetical protein
MSATGTLINATADAQAPATTRLTSQAAVNAAPDELWRALVSVLPTRAVFETGTDSTTTVQDWLRDDIVLAQRLRSVEARVVLSAQDEEFDIRLIPSSDDPPR